MSTTSKLGADMPQRNERIEKAMHELHSAFIDCTIHAQDAFALHAYVIELENRCALLARQPAAIDKQEAKACPECGGSLKTWKCLCDPIWPGYAAPLANEASKPAPSATCSVSADCKWPKCRRDCVIKTDAAPLVEQDQRGAFEAWARDEGMDLERGIIGAGAYNDSSTQACWRGWKHRARAASTSANVAQGAEAVSDEHAAVLWRLARMTDAIAWTAELRKAIAPPAQHKSDWHPDFVTALYDNADPDKRYTMDQMREYADAFHRSRIDAALTAAQSASGDTK